MPRTGSNYPVKDLAIWAIRLAAGAALLGGAALAQDDRPVEAAITKAFSAGELKSLHAALVILNGETLAEVYFEGVDEQRGRQLGVVQNGPNTLHDIRSVTKSLVALLYGIALADGEVAGPEAPLLAQFPEYADLVGDPRRDRITIGDALAMKMGTAWNETLPYTDPLNSETAMDESADPDRFALDRPMVTEPGAEWTYNGGAAALIGRLIEDGTGMALDDYARDKLFEPLGIERWDWARRQDGKPSAASGLRLTARDLAKIGQLVADHGKFAGRQVVPSGWFDAVFTPRTTLVGVRYGYFWWLANSKNPRGWIGDLGHQLPGTEAWPAWVGAIGNGGQRLSIQPDIGLIVVTFAGDYNDPDDWEMPVRLTEEYVAPELRLRFFRKYSE